MSPVIEFCASGRLTCESDDGKRDRWSDPPDGAETGSHGFPSSTVRMLSNLPVELFERILEGVDILDILQLKLVRSLFTVQTLLS